MATSSSSTVVDNGVAGAPAGLEVGACLPNGFVDVEVPFEPAATVECTESHRGEVVGIVALADATGFPGVGSVSQQADTICIEDFENYLDLAFRSSPLSMTPVFPTDRSWDAGDRAVLCVVTFETMENRALDDFKAEELVLPDGEVFSFLLAPGDCFASDAALGAPRVPVVGCDEDHQFELYASIDLPNGDFPTIETLANLADGACFEEFERYTGMVFAESGLLYQFLYPSEESWESGDRQVLCLVDSGEDVTESVAGDESTDDAEA